MELRKTRPRTRVSGRRPSPAAHTAFRTHAGNAKSLRPSLEVAAGGASRFPKAPTDPQPDRTRPVPPAPIPAAAQARRARRVAAPHPVRTPPPRLGQGLLAAGSAPGPARASRGSPARRAPEGPVQTPRPDARRLPTPHPAVPGAAAGSAEGGRLASVFSKKSNSGISAIGKGKRCSESGE